MVGLCVLALGCGSRTGLTSLVEEGSPLAPSSPDAGADADAGPIDGGYPILALVPAPASGEGTYEYELARFDPTSNAFSESVPIPCLLAFNDRPTSMAVRCDGSAYVQFLQDGIWHVSTSSPCERTPFDAAAAGLSPQVVLGSALDRGDEALAFLGTRTTDGTSVFGELDPGSLDATIVGPFDLPIDPRTTHLGWGRSDTRAPAGPSSALFAAAAPALGAIDVSSGAFLAEATLPDQPWASQAFAIWGSQLYFFALQASGDTQVVRYSIGDTQGAVVASTTRSVLAAGVSVCAASP